jgi:hypothetical protein
MDQSHSLTKYGHQVLLCTGLKQAQDLTTFTAEINSRQDELNQVYSYLHELMLEILNTKKMDVNRKQIQRLSCHTVSAKAKYCPVC